MCVDETPDLLQHALSELADEIEHRIARKDKTAYLVAHQQQLDFIYSKDMRLRFLRCELFDSKKVARQMMQYLNFALKLWGDIIRNSLQDRNVHPMSDQE